MIYIVVSSWVCLIYFYLGVFAYRTNKINKLNKAFLIYNASLSFASLCNMCMYITQDTHSYWIWYRLSVLFWCINAGYSLNISLLLTKSQQLLRRKLCFTIIYIPIPIIMIYEIFFMRNAQQGNVIVFTVFTIFEYIYLFGYPVASMSNIWLWGKDKARLLREKKQAKLIVCAGVCTMLISLSNMLLIYIFNIKTMPDISHLISFLYDLSIWYAIIKYRLINIKSLVSGEDIIAKVTDIIFIIDTYENIANINSRCEELLEYKVEELVGCHISKLIIPWEGVMSIHKETSVHNDSYMNLNCIAKSGKKIPVNIQASTVTDKAGEIVGTAVICKDMTWVKELQVEIEERKAREKELKYLSLHDPLTGLYNRWMFEQEMSKYETDEHVSVGIIVCDVDGLKLVNDTMGHDEGDKLLAASANIISEVFKERGKVYRTGGDEFVVLMQQVDFSSLKESETYIYKHIDQINSKNQGFHISISVGYAIYKGMGKSIADTYKEADNSMYRKKLNHAKSAKSSMVQGFIKLLEVRDFITEGHGERMKNLVVELGKSMGLSENKLVNLSLLAQFHDIGKVGIPDKILFKQGPLDDNERSGMQQHSEIGYRIAKSIPELSPISELILKHHERWNGEGYPLGLRAHEIPLECRILAIVDAYDAMTNDRPYRQSLKQGEVVNELIKNAGSQFDPILVEKFFKLLESKGMENAG